MKIVASDFIPKVPPQVATCPICGAEVVIDEIYEWYVDESMTHNGRPLLEAGETGIGVNCITEPDIDSDEWEGWFNHHWSMPYVDWLPVEHRVREWLNANYRFEDGSELPRGVTEDNYRTFWTSKLETP